MNKKVHPIIKPNMADMIVLFVAVVDVGTFFFLAVNPYFNQVGFSKRLTASILPLKKKKCILQSSQNIIDTIAFFMAAVNVGKFSFFFPM